jgi:type IV pilus assembly protein PilQ
MNKIIFLIMSFILFRADVFADENLAAARDPFQPLAENSGGQNLENQNLVSALLVIKYGDADYISKLISAANSGFLSPSGMVSADPRTNAVWVKDDQVHVSQIKKFLRDIDVPAKQIEIEARIVNADEAFTRELGFKFGTVQAGSNKDSNGLSLDTPLVQTGTGHFSFVIANLGHGSLLDMEISALESEGHAKVISSPKLVTLNRKAAHIEAGEDIPYQQRSGEGNTDIAFKKAVLGLKVTPEIISNTQIILNIAVNQDTVSTIQIEGVPAISTREIQTQVLVNDGQTLVLGGIYEESTSKNKVGIPYLSAIPYLGWLFTSVTNETQRKELLIFITPKIL